MKLYATYIVCCFLLGFSNSGRSAEFKKSVNRLVAPASVADVVSFESSYAEKLLEVSWPEHIQGWVTQAQISTFLKSEGVGFTESWKGMKKVWVELCHRPDIAQTNGLIKAHVSKLLDEERLIFKRYEGISKEKLPCLDHVVKSQKLIDGEIVGPSLIKAQLAFYKVNDEVVYKDITVGYRANVEALVLTRKGRKHAELDGTSLIKKVMPWTGKELESSTDLSNLRLIRNLAANAVLKSRYVEVIPDITAGRKLKVSIEHGPVQIETTGRAITSGNIGQVIKVQVEGSKVVSEARVIKKGVVNVSV